MKTPLTITASVWNFCQNNCSYCVSGSNDPDWNFNGSFKFFSPPGDNKLNHQQLIFKHGPDYYDQLCKDKKTYMNKGDILDFDYLIFWLMNHAPGAKIHLAGGEPLLRPDIEEQTAKLIDSGFEVCILTNGLLIPKRKKLLTMPITWLVTHHPQNDLKKFLTCIEPIKSKPHLINRVMADSRDLKIKDQITDYYSGFNFEWKDCNAPSPGNIFKYNKEDLHQIASNTFQLIISDGSIYPCNTIKYGTIGNIYANNYDLEKAKKIDNDCFKCVVNNGCGAYQTAVKVSDLQEKNK